VARINVKDGERVKEDSQGESNGHSDEFTEPEGQKEEDIPFDKMTKEELLEKIKGVQESVEKNFDLYVRSQAEMDNLKKRSQKEREELIRFSNESLIKQLLPVVDNLEKTLEHSKDGNSLDALREGVELTLKGLMDTLEKAGVEKVKAAGESFDPNFHAAMSEQEDDSVEPGTVLQEFQKGYVLNKRLIRPAMVVISKNTSKNSKN
jgi:molecular chaperone GrpE